MAILKANVTTAPAGCTCEMVELKNAVKDSPVKSYTEKSVCAVCKAIQVDNAKAAAEQQAERDKEMMIRIEMDALQRAEAVASLKAKGLI